MVLSGTWTFSHLKVAENLSAQTKEVADIKTPETFVNTRLIPIRAKSLSRSRFEAIFASIFV
jgi:hypothetical protein